MKLRKEMVSKALRKSNRPNNPSKVMMSNKSLTRSAIASTRVSKPTSKFWKETLVENSRTRAHLFSWRELLESTRLSHFTQSSTWLKCPLQMIRKSSSRSRRLWAFAHSSNRRYCLQLRTVWMILMSQKMKYYMERLVTCRYYSSWRKTWCNQFSL